MSQDSECISTKLFIASLNFILTLSFISVLLNTALQK